MITPPRPPCPEDNLCLAVDATSTREAQPWVEELAPHLGALKIGLELFVREGPSAVAWARSFGRDVFVDLKLHDIPETVERAVASLSSLGVRYATIHASGGARMVERAVERARRDDARLLLLAVTTLTSLGDDDMPPLGVAETASAHALRLARLAHTAGARGFVCSGSEAATLRAALGDEVTLVTPGVRPASAPAGDQRRVVTAREAIAAGSNLLVVGRPLRDARDRRAAVHDLLREVVEGQNDRAKAISQPRPSST